jgi:hypothetical protein
MLVVYCVNNALDMAAHGSLSSLVENLPTVKFFLQT